MAASNSEYRSFSIPKRENSSPTERDTSTTRAEGLLKLSSFVTAQESKNDSSDENLSPMKYSLRSLMIAGAVLPPLLAVTAWLWRESDLSFGELAAITALWFAG